MGTRRSSRLAIGAPRRSRCSHDSCDETLAAAAMVVCPHCKAENFDKAESCFRCGQPLTLTEGSIVAGRYQIQSLVGKGGMGAVYRAHDKILEETVALKILLSTVARSPEM